MAYCTNCMKNVRGKRKFHLLICIITGILPYLIIHSILPANVCPICGMHTLKKSAPIALTYTPES